MSGFPRPARAATNARCPPSSSTACPTRHHVWHRVLAALDRSDVVVPVAARVRHCRRPTASRHQGGVRRLALGVHRAASGEPVDLVGHDWGGMLVVARRLAAAGPRPDLGRGDGVRRSRLRVARDRAASGRRRAGEAVHGDDDGRRDDGRLRGGGRPRRRRGRRGPPDRRHDEAVHPGAVPVGGARGHGVGSPTSPASRARHGALGRGRHVRVGALRRAAGRADRARFVGLAGCGHWWPLERPAEVAAALRRLWADQPSR